MRAPISIVIPTLNSQNTVRKTLASLFEGIEAGIVRELIVVDGGSTDETREIVEECGGKFISSAASRGYQLKKGVNLAKGDFIFVLHSDSVLEPGWSEIVKKYFNKINIIDLSADFRLDNFDVYKENYGNEHECKEHLNNFIYGLAEIYRDKIEKSKNKGKPTKRI